MVGNVGPYRIRALAAVVQHRKPYAADRLRLVAGICEQDARIAAYLGKTPAAITKQDRMSFAQSLGQNTGTLAAEYGVSTRTIERIRSRYYTHGLAAAARLSTTKLPKRLQAVVSAHLPQHQ